MVRIFCASVLLGLVAAGGMAQGDAAGYLQRVSLALGELKMIREDQSYSTEGISNIKQMLPRHESLETDYGAMNVDNAWLHGMLDSYRSETGKRERTQKLEEVTERLRALESHLKRRDASKAEGADVREQMKSILSRPEYKEKPESPITALIKKAKKKIIELIQEIVRRISARVGGSTTAGWILKGLVVAAISGAVFLIVRVGFRKRPGRKPRAKVTVLGEEIDAGTTPADLSSAAFSAARAGDFRTAIRKLYIASLYEFSERGILELEPNATNHDYLNRVSRFAALVAPMRYMTDRFDYVWYGMYPSSSDEFSGYLDQYRNLVAQVRSLPGQSA
jgi:hypothetical protein